MELVTWKAEMSVGVKKVDEQHKKLVSMINDLHEAMLAAKGKDALGRLFMGLADYTSTHFQTEEELMEIYGYPREDFEHHRLEHKKLIAQVAELKKKAAAGELAISVDIMNFLRDWLTGHIMGTDKKMGPFFESKGMS